MHAWRVLSFEFIKLCLAQTIGLKMHNNKSKYELVGGDANDSYKSGIARGNTVINFVSFRNLRSPLERAINPRIYD